jgi:WhiB family transcriptional regulator, redox-sensing transcriptional regulator
MSKPINVGRMRAPKKLPTVGDLCQDIRDGHTTAEIAALYEVGEGWIRTKIRTAGWHPDTGLALPRPARPPVQRTDRPEWMAEALCGQTGIDDGTWYPLKGGSTRPAKALCRRCPVRAECLDYALAHDERFGVWGGLSEQERHQLKQLTNRKTLEARA